MKKQHTIPCDCVGTCGVALVTDFEPFDDEKPEMFIEMFEHISGAGSLRHRLKVAWKVARGRDPWSHGVCIQNRAKVTDLRDFLTECLDATA
jgi:hypothetical protein